MPTEGPARSAAFLPWAAAALALALPGAARADTFYYAMVFGSQQTPPDPRYSHSFATYVKATGRGPCAQAYRLEAYTVSWLPRSLDIRVLAVLPECGVNLGLYETLRYALGNGERISLWGPYQVGPEVYDSAVRQVGLLESGRVGYKSVDSGYPSDRVSNCIHAVSSITGGHRRRVLGPGWGETASYLVTRELMPWVIDRGRTHDWVSTRLGLDAWPIIHRPFEHPRSGLIDSALGRDPLLRQSPCCGP